MCDKEKVNYFNHCFTTILDKFPVDIPPHYSIKKYYYNTMLPSHVSIVIQKAQNW